MWNSILSVRHWFGFLGDYCDKLVCFYTPLMLLFFASAVGLYQLIGSPMTCWTPVQFPDRQSVSADRACWHKDWYRITQSSSSDLPTGDPSLAEQNKEDFVWNFYPYIPLILVCTAIVLYVPMFLWKWNCRFLGLNVDLFSRAATSPISSISDHSLRKVAAQAAKQLDQYLNGDYEETRGCSPFMSCLQCRFFVSLGYLSMKIAHIGLLLSVYALFTFLLRANFLLFGLMKVLQVFNLTQQVDLSGLEPKWLWTSPEVPHEVYCDLEVRSVANVQKYTFQCGVHINKFNDKMFIFLWFWLLSLLALSSINLFMWVFRLLCCSYEYIHAIRTSHNRHEDQPGPEVTRFMSEYVKLDGRLILKLVASSADPIVTNEIVNELYGRCATMTELLDIEGVPHGAMVPMEDEMRGHSMSLPSSRQHPPSGAQARPSGAVGGLYQAPMADMNYARQQQQQAPPSSSPNVVLPANWQYSQGNTFEMRKETVSSVNTGGATTQHRASTNASSPAGEDFEHI